MPFFTSVDASENSKHLQHPQIPQLRFTFILAVLMHYKNILYKSHILIENFQELTSSI